MSPSALGLLLLLLGDLVSVLPSEGMVRLGDGDQSRFELTVRNLQPVELEDLSLQVEADECEVQTRPLRIPQCQPADRCAFEITVRRRPDTPRTRFPIRLTVSAKGHPRLSRFRMLVDAMPGAAPPAARDGWVDVGVLRVEGEAGRKRGWILALLALLPVAGLLALGAWLKRRARREGP